MQYQQVAAEPYETIAFAIPSKELVTEEEDPDSIWESWDPDSKVSRRFIFRFRSAGWLNPNWCHRSGLFVPVPFQIINVRNCSI